MISNEEALRDANQKLPISSQIFCAILGTTTLAFGLSALLAGPAHGHPFHAVSLILLFVAIVLMGYDLSTSYKLAPDVPARTMKAWSAVGNRSKGWIGIVLIFIGLIIPPIAAGAFGLYTHSESVHRREEAARSAPVVEAKVSQTRVEGGKNGRFLLLLETTDPSKQTWFAALPKDFNELKEGRTLKVYVTEGGLVPVTLQEDTRLFISLFFFSLPLISLVYYGYLRRKLLSLTGRGTRKALLE